MSSTDRYERQSEFVPAELVASTAVTIIGLGAIGKPLAESLACIGVTHIRLFDPDVVEEVNLPTQGYIEDDLSSYKVDCVSELIKRKNKALSTQANRQRWASNGGLNVQPAVFCCVDSIVTRKEIWDSCEEAANRPRFWCDARMLGLSLRIISAWDDESKKHYETTLYKEEEIQKGRCTARSAVWPATIAANLMVNQYVRFLNNQPANNIDFLFNLATLEVIDQSKPASNKKPSSRSSRLRRKTKT